MYFKLNKKVLTDDNIDAVYKEILSVTEQDVSETTKNQLIEIFLKTSNYKLLDKIALIFADLKDDNLVPILIGKINEIRTSGHLTTLIYACSEYDCAEYIDFFTELIIEFNNSVYIEAVGVLAEVSKKVSLSDKVICIKKLSTYLCTLSKGHEKYKDVEYALQLIEDMKT